MKCLPRRWTLVQFGLALGASFSCAGCRSNVTDVPLVSGGSDTTSTNPSGVVPRTSLTVQVVVDSADQALASALGINTAGLTVRLTRGASLEGAKTAVTDASGRVRFDQLLDGTYSVSVERALSPAEVVKLTPVDRDVTIMSGGATVAVSPPKTASATVPLVGARRGGLVISEMTTYLGNPPYNWGSYLEITNNSDRTLYLDGYILAAGSTRVLYSEDLANCDEPSFVKWRSDTRRLWLAGDGTTLRFPGNGQDFPIASGETRVYSQDALDHRTISGLGEFADLSRADFEHVGGQADTDNPLAANMEVIFGIDGGTAGRGWRPPYFSTIALIRPGSFSRFVPDTAPPLQPYRCCGVPPKPSPLFGINVEEIVDVFTNYYSPERQARLRTTTSGLQKVCQPFPHPALDKAPAELENELRPGSMRRRALGLNAAGRPILMRTRNSSRDWEISQNLLERWRK